MKSRMVNIEIGCTFEAAQHEAAEQQAE